jgi:hypothetical protein
MESLTPYLIGIPALLILSVVVSKGAGATAYRPYRSFC